MFQAIISPLNDTPPKGFNKMNTSIIHSFLRPSVSSSFTDSPNKKRSLKLRNVYSPGREGFELLRNRVVITSQR